LSLPCVFCCWSGAVEWNEDGASGLLVLLLSTKGGRGRRSVLVTSCCANAFSLVLFFMFFQQLEMNPQRIGRIPRKRFATKHPHSSFLPRRKPSTRKKTVDAKKRTPNSLSARSALLSRLVFFTTTQTFTPQNRCRSTYDLPVSDCCCSGRQCVSRARVNYGGGIGEGVTHQVLR